MASTILLSDNGVSSGSAGLKEQGGNDGVLILQTTTAGGTATNALYIDATQNLGLGVTPTLGKLQVAGNVYSSGSYILANDGYLYWGAGDGSCSIQGNSSSEYIAFKTTGTEAMRINSSGNVGIGTTAPDALLTLNKSSGATDIRLKVGGTLYGTAYASSSDFTINSTAAIPLTFGTNNAERARIDSSGNLLVGTTSASARVTIVGANALDSAYAVAVYNSTPSLLFGLRNDGYAFLPTTYSKTVGSAANMFISSDGSLYRSTSSLKYKTNVQDAAHGLAELLTLRPITYQGKVEATTEATFGGLIAEEVHEAGLTEFVQYAEDGTPDALAYGPMVSLCIKAIQEQQALITTLTERITALEGAQA